MKKKLPSLLLMLIFICRLSAQDINKKISATWEDLNKPYTVKLEIQNNQVLFAKPLSSIEISLASPANAITVLKKKEPYPFEKKEQTVKILLPSENNTLKVSILFPNKEELNFTILTAIIDTDTNDGEIKYEGQTYLIGKYPLIPSKGKTNYFKNKYEHPKYFFKILDVLHIYFFYPARRFTHFKNSEIQRFSYKA